MKIINLIKLEFLKYKDNSLVQMLILFYTILMPSLIFVMKSIKGVGLPSTDSYFTFPNIWEYQAYSGSWLSFFFLGYLGVFLITSEFQYKTLRQNIINGLSRKDFFISKISIFIIISIYATLVFYISTMIIGYLHQDTYELGEIFNQQNFVAIRFFLFTFAYMVFGMLLAFIIRKPGLSMFMYFSYILFIELIIRWWLHKYILIEKLNIKLFGDAKAIFYYPMNAIEDLAPSPLFKFSDKFIKGNDFMLLSYSEAIVLSSAYVILFIGLAYFFLKRRDI